MKVFQSARKASRRRRTRVRVSQAYTPISPADEARLRALEAQQQSFAKRLLRRWFGVSL